MSDYFLYCAGDAAADPSRPPSLSLLPPFYVIDQEEGRPKEKRYMDDHGTALLRRDQDEVLVAAMDFFVEEEHDVLEAELCLLRYDKWEWELKRLPVIHDEGKRQEISCWKTDKVIPVGDRLLLWVDNLRGIIYSDPWQETPELRYVSLPVKPDLSPPRVPAVDASPPRTRDLPRPLRRRQRSKSKSHAQPARGMFPALCIYRRDLRSKPLFVRILNSAPLFSSPAIIFIFSHPCQQPLTCLFVYGRKSLQRT
jgi:hypothetical protein